MNNNRIFRFYVFLRTFLLFPRFRAFFWFAICSDQIGPERKCPVSEKAANLPDQMRYAGSGNFIYKCGKGHGPKQSMPGEGMDYLLRFMRLSAHLSLSAIVSIINQVWRNDNGPNIRIILIITRASQFIFLASGCYQHWSLPSIKSTVSFSIWAWITEYGSLFFICAIKRMIKHFFFLLILQPIY